MHKVHLNYSFDSARSAAAPEQRELHHPLMALLAAIHASGSISGAARQLGFSYRHVWGELKRWELELGHTLVVWAKGQPALLSPFGEKLLWAERRAQARLAPQIEALRGELERAFAIAFDDSAGVITMTASHDAALPRLREFAQLHHRLHLDIQFTGSVDALAALNEGRCLLAGFHALADHASSASLRSPTARVYRPMLKPGRHKLISFAQRSQGLMVAAGNPLHIESLRDLTRADVRFVNRPRGTGTRVVLEELLAGQRLASTDIAGFERSEPSHEAAAEAVASSSADVAFGIEAAARSKGLDFVALAQEQYFLVTLAATLQHPHVQALLALLATPAWRATLTQIPGYAAERSGEVLSLRRVLPWWNYRSPKRR
ncbi:substrate-binding domain-containing protein [Piscinibacter sp.]|jgi:putative molybdopterin biosynthesis protein|uniref:substrate-binding domain-containing protein n=1 Tax=Piscinibacter sp. TaxID=1903157 RepID=UPI00355A4C9C